MPRLPAVICAVACAYAAGGAGPANAITNTAMVTVHPNGPEAARGIGVVRLGETQAAVVAALGAGVLLHAGTQEGFSPAEQSRYEVYRYRSGTITIEVDYGEGATQPGVANEVDSIRTSSPSALLFGHRLAAGLKTF